jgi:tetratricopeptide (TPR) repeat protein
MACVATVVAGQSSSESRAAPRTSSWSQIVTPDFIVIGNVAGGELRRVLRELTRFRQTFARLFPKAVTDSPVPTYVVVLRDYQSFQRFEPRDSRGKRTGNVGGYFLLRPDANFIVFGTPRSNDETTLRTVFHEYTHYMVSRNVRSAVPMWLSEGLADFYSTFRGDYRGRTLLGAIPPERERTLKELTFVPLRDIVSPHDMETKWRWEKQIGMFYAESWALVHYVTVERQNPGPNALSTYLTSLARTGSQDQAFMAAFGVDVDGMDKELREYVRRVSLHAILIDLQVEQQAPDEAKPMLEADLNAVEGRLLLELGVPDEAERELTAALTQNPKHVAARIALANLRLSQDREDEAITALQEVVAAASDNGAAQYYLGTALERAWRHDEALAAFAKAIDLMPNNPSPWSGLNTTALALHRDAQAAAAIQNAMQIEWSPSYYWTQATEAMRLGRDDIAASSAGTYVQLRGNGEDASVYPLFIRAIAARRAGRSAEADAALALAEKGDINEPWTRSVLRFLQGRVEESTFLQLADNIGERTEAHTYIGFALALAGRGQDAMTHFRWVADRGAKGYTEYALARNELNRLKYEARATVRR